MPSLDDRGSHPLHLRGPILTGPDTVAAQAWVVGGRITYQAPASGPVPLALDGWVLPGLVDAHCHVGLDRNGAVDRQTTERQALTDRDAGALLLRDAGSPADTRWLDDRLDLPVVVRAGRHIARTRRYLRNYAVEIEPDQLADTVREQAHRGDGWVKLVGDWIDREIGDLAPCWPAAALGPAIEAAHQEGARVTAHCFGEDCLPDLLAAGIDGIEHATGLSEDTLATAVERRVALVPTLVNIATFPAIAAAAERFPRYAKHMLALHERRYPNIATAFEAGARIFTGTDAGGSLSHGLVASEVAELVRAGLPAVAALDAACWAARRWLGRPALAEGDPADLVVYRADPRTDVGVLAHPSRIVLRGRLLAGTTSAG